MLLYCHCHMFLSHHGRVLLYCHHGFCHCCLSFYFSCCLFFSCHLFLFLFLLCSCLSHCCQYVSLCSLCCVLLLLVLQVFYEDGSCFLFTCIAPLLLLFM